MDPYNNVRRCCRQLLDLSRYTIINYLLLRFPFRCRIEYKLFISYSFVHFFVCVDVVLFGSIWMAIDYKEYNTFFIFFVLLLLLILLLIYGMQLVRNSFTSSFVFHRFFLHFCFIFFIFDSCLCCCCCIFSGFDFIYLKFSASF